jgi:hypothetical protein
MTVLPQYIRNALLAVFIAQDLNIYAPRADSPGLRRVNVKFLAELGWLFPEKRYLKTISPDIPAG